MTLEEMEGRLVALEAIAMSALGMALATAARAGDAATARAMLANIENTVAAQAVGLREGVQDAAREYGRMVIFQVRQTLPLLAGDTKLLE